MFLNMLIILKLRASKRSFQWFKQTKISWSEVWTVWRMLRQFSAHFFNLFSCLTSRMWWTGGALLCWRTTPDFSKPSRFLRPVWVCPGGTKSTRTTPWVSQRRSNNLACRRTAAPWISWGLAKTRASTAV